MHVVRYETALAEPEATLLTLSDDVGLGLSRASIAEAVAANTAERMRAKESSSTRLEAITKREGQSFVRAASAGGWQDALTPDQVERLEAVGAGADAGAGLPPGHRAPTVAATEVAAPRTPDHQEAVGPCSASSTS